MNEIAIINCHNNPYHGLEVEIISELIPKGSKYNKGTTISDGYHILIEGDEGYSAEKYLRKKKPPQVLSRWEDIEKIPLGSNGEGWNPTKVPVDA